MPGGRPPKWTDPKVIEEQGMKFFAQRRKENRPLTITGLALAWDTTRDVLMDYQEKDQFSYTIKKLKAYCEDYAEEQALSGSNQAGSIFALKNYGWKDKQEIDHTTGGDKMTALSPTQQAIVIEAEKMLLEKL